MRWLQLVATVYGIFGLGCIPFGGLRIRGMSRPEVYEKTRECKFKKTIFAAFVPALLQMFPQIVLFAFALSSPPAQFCPAPFHVAFQVWGLQSCEAGAVCLFSFALWLIILPIMRMNPLTDQDFFFHSLLVVLSPSHHL